MKKTFPVYRTLLAAVLMLSVAMAGCATLGIGNYNLVSLEEEWQLGAQLERDIAQQLPLVHDQEMLSYINRVGQQIVARTEMANLPWKFHVVADPAINAFNIPGGHVYVYTGLIDAAGNAAELAGVMAHEIAHGVQRHGTQRLTKMYEMQMITGVLLGSNPAVYQQILAQIVGTGAVASFSRSDEREADRLGIRYMHQAGYNPDGMASMFERILAERNRRPSAVEQFFSTHPLTEDRIADARRQAQSLPQGNVVTDEAGFRSAKQRAQAYAR
jgi:beta-barrel assembly-enhancing protease